MQVKSIVERLFCIYLINFLFEQVVFSKYAFQSMLDKNTDKCCNYLPVQILNKRLIIAG